MKKQFSWPLLFLILAFAIVLFSWTRIELSSLTIDRDWARDLKEISNIHRGDIVWLGPWLNPGLHASSSYYYFFYPAMYLAQGHPLGMVYFNLVLFAISLGVFGILLFRRNPDWAGLIVLAVGLTPMMLESSFHPGNGFSYVALVLLGLSFWLHKRYLWVSSAALGLASSFHPGALLLVPLLVPSYLKLLRKPLHLTLNLALLIIPWLPLVGYEVVTKGFIIRQFLDQPSGGSISFSPSLQSLTMIAGTLGLSLNMLLAALVITGWTVFKANKPTPTLCWIYGFSGGLLLFLSLFTGFLDRYLYAVALLVQLLVLFSFKKQWWGKLVVAGYVVRLLIALPGFAPTYLKPSEHTVDVVVSNARSFLLESPELRGEVITVLSALPGVKLDPQGDDYRSFLRFRGYDVVDVTQNSKAEYLVIFVEDEAFEWEGWSNWEIEQFGEKQLERIIDLPKGKAVVYRSTMRL